MRLMLLYVAIFFSFSVSAQEDFQAGLKAYQEGEYKKSSKVFFELSKQHPTNPAILYNLGLTSYQLNRKGLALGLWRKARYFESDPLVIEAISFVEEELGMAQSHEGFFPGMVHWFKGFSATFYILFSTLLLLLIGWPATTHFAKRKTPIPHWPPWIFALSPILVVMICLSIWQTLGEQKLYGTIVEVDVSTRTGPSLDAPTLTSLDEGAIVRIIKKYDNWYQVKANNGSPGWILKDKIIPEKGPL